MHQLLLFAPVPTTRHTLVLNILAGIAAMQPRPFHKKHTIYKPLRPLGSVKSTQVGGSQAVGAGGMQALQGSMQGELFYLHLVEEGVADVGAEDGGEEDVVMGEREGEVCFLIFSLFCLCL